MGVMFYELLTGRKPFVAESPVDMFLMHVNAEPVRAGKLVLSIPTWLDTLVDQLMAKKPEHRPFDAAMVAKALEEVEEKAIKQQSAGLDAVTARRIDRPGSGGRGCRPRSRPRPRSAVTRKKIRKKSAADRIPSLVSGGVADRAFCSASFGVIYFMTSPPSAAKLYELAKVAVEAGRRGPGHHNHAAIRRYLSQGERRTRPGNPPLARAVLGRQAREATLQPLRAEAQALEDDRPRKLQAASAMHYENDGDIDNARRVWTEMEDAFQGAHRSRAGGVRLGRQEKADDLDQLDSRTAALKSSFSTSSVSAASSILSRSPSPNDWR